MVLLSTHDVRAQGAGPARRPARPRCFRFARTGALLTVIAVMRLAQIARCRWRLSLALAGVLLEILGHSLLAGSARGTADLLGLAVMLVVFLKSGDAARTRGPAAVPLAAWPWRG